MIETLWGIGSKKLSFSGRGGHVSVEGIICRGPWGCARINVACFCFKIVRGWKEDEIELGIRDGLRDFDKRTTDGHGFTRMTRS